MFGQLLFVLCFFWTQAAYSTLAEPAFPDKGLISDDVNHGMDLKIDYAHFTGRVTDKDDTNRIFKVNVENNNSKFFRVGDLVYFEILSKKKDHKCKGVVRNSEDFYFTMYVERLDPCWSDGYFRRGTVLQFESKALEHRIFEATKFREILILRKEDFLRQLNSINHYLWTFDQQKIKVAADYDEQIAQLQRARQKTLDDLIQHKQEQLALQSELMKQLNELDASLKFYQIERQELLTDRWEMDHDSALPVGQRPQDMKKE